MISIGRAILKDSPILILDEPTSNIDERLQSKIFKIIDIYFKNKIIMNIAHKVETI